ncbi:hypothetical protein CJP74_04450 [Psittacicella melopsittaci]|uniref:Phosphocarrier protein HPr n=1 Tax=Psittacicella melopsittaci TaxID=2028576 RepID=A0A3A1Y2F1_9GAMM|nr:HPr family phosphocarrier protein [Psittacicella melopsittaci]RIY32502.1 hypothetical protein CJP74_04450 [Psittacicella melopsittaci]
MTVSKDLTIVAPHGIHMRPATTLAKAAKEFESKVTLTANGETVSAKSALKVISLNLEHGKAFTLTCDGPDEEKALETLSALMDTLE